MDSTGRYFPYHHAKVLRLKPKINLSVYLKIVSEKKVKCHKLLGKEPAHIHTELNE